MNAAIASFVLIAAFAARHQAAPVAVTMKGAEPCVAATTLEREAGIVIKRLPGRGGFVACAADRCAPVKPVHAEGDNWLVPVAGLSEAMNLTASYDTARRYVTFGRAASDSMTNAGPVRVGAIVPNLRLTKLDGTSVSIDELRGQRVLINSWASW